MSAAIDAYEKALHKDEDVKSSSSVYDDALKVIPSRGVDNIPAVHTKGTGSQPGFITNFGIYMYDWYSYAISQFYQDTGIQFYIRNDAYPCGSKVAMSSMKALYAPTPDQQLVKKWNTYWYSHLKKSYDEESKRCGDIKFELYDAWSSIKKSVDKTTSIESKRKLVYKHMEQYNPSAKFLRLGDRQQLEFVKCTCHV